MSTLRRVVIVLVTLVIARCGLGAVSPEGTTIPEGPDTVQLAAGGKAKVEITIAAGASEDLKQTAKELADYLKRITGADFAIEPGEKPKGLTLGTIEQFPDEVLKAAMPIKDSYDGLEAFSIRTDKGGVRLIGNSDLGTSHAAHRFLELAGCRWFFQGDTWTVVPRQANLTFNLNETSRPDILSRDIWFGRTTQKWEPGDPDANEFFAQWARGNRMASSLKVMANHKWQALPAQFKEDFEGHPEYFALVKGKRSEPGPGTQLCVTNPGLQKVVLKYVNSYFEKNPAAVMVSLDPADAGGWCTCPECSKIGVSDQAFYLANIAAKELQKTHPGKLVGVLAYSWHSDPPAFDLEPNVYVQLTAGLNASMKTFDELFEEWPKKCKHMGIYEYYSYWQMDNGMMPGTGVASNYEGLGERMKRFAASGVNSISAQGANSWGATGLANYLAVRLMWNCSADVLALKKDFYEKAFGPASAVMERYYERTNQANKPLKGMTLLRQCLDDLEQASGLATGRPDLIARLDALKENLVYNHIGLQVDAETELKAQKEKTLEWMTWSYRTRNNYMNDWITFRSAVGRPAAEEWGETTWFWRNTNKNPWRVDKPVTREELEHLLQAMKKELGDAPNVKEEKFSDQFVLVKIGNAPAEARKQSYLGKATHVLASRNGESLRFTVSKHDTGQLVKPDAKYTLSTLDGKQILAGSFPTGEHELELKVPEAGNYLLTCNRGGAGWDAAYPATLSHAVVFERGKTRPNLMLPKYFYVPKGTKSVVMYVGLGSTATVRRPNNQVAHQGRSDGSYITIPVDKGEDGKMWSISGKISNLWFLNIPTVLSGNPSDVFLPADVAKRDGLKPALQ